MKASELKDKNRQVYLETYEREIIAMILGDRNNNRNKIIDSLEVDMFTHKLYKNFFEQMKKLRDAGEEVNLFAVCRDISSKDKRELVKELQNEYLTNINYQFYVEEIQKCYLERKIAEAKSPEDVENIETIRKTLKKEPLLKHISNGAEQLIADYYNSFESSVYSGFKNVDSILGSFLKGDYVILAGATSSGKTMYMLNMAINMAKTQKKRVDIYSLEMKNNQLVNRIACSELKINAAGFRHHSWTAKQVENIADYISEKLPKLPINVNLKSKLELQELCEDIRKSDAEVVFIDYLGLIRNSKVSNKYDKISEISMDLKSVALDSNKILIVLHQLSRMPSNREDKTPKLSDLRDSGQIEQDADTVMFTYRPHYYYEDDPEDAMYLIVAKNRGGRLGKADLTCDLSTQSVMDRIRVF